MAILAMFASMIAVRSEARRLGWNVRQASWLVIQCTLFGFIGAHLLYVLTRFDLPSYLWWKKFFDFTNGFVWFGGFLTSWGWCHYWARKRGIKALEMYDVAAFAVLLALPTGRIGCFFNGCCFGKPTDLPWGVTLHTRDFGYATLHPAPAYEMIYQYTLFAILWKLRKRHRQAGMTAALYLIFTPLGRFLIEFVRGDSVRGFVFGWISTSQFIAIGIFAAGVVLLKRLTSTASSY